MKKHLSQVQFDRNNHFESFFKNNGCFQSLFQEIKNDAAMFFVEKDLQKTFQHFPI